MQRDGAMEKATMRVAAPAALAALTLSGCTPVMLRDPETGHVTQCTASGAFPLINRQQCISAHEQMGWVETTPEEARRASVWEKTGSTLSEFNADKAQCIVTASQQVPRAMEPTSTSFGYTTPIQTNCYRTGNTTSCNTSGGVAQPPVTTIEDVNTETRNYAFDSCMYSKGYKRRGQ
jgi:hypothetical protein